MRYTTGVKPLAVTQKDFLVYNALKVYNSSKMFLVGEGCARPLAFPVVSGKSNQNFIEAFVNGVLLWKIFILEIVVTCKNLGLRRSTNNIIDLNLLFEQHIQSLKPWQALLCQLARNKNIVRFSSGKNKTEYYIKITHCFLIDR